MKQQPGSDSIPEVLKTMRRRARFLLVYFALTAIALAVGIGAALILGLFLPTPFDTIVGVAIGTLAQWVAFAVADWIT